VKDLSAEQTRELDRSRDRWNDLEIRPVHELFDDFANDHISVDFRSLSSKQPSLASVPCRARSSTDNNEAEQQKAV
jgi:hypothetical protein